MNSSSGKTKLKKAAAVLVLSSMIMSFVSCARSSKYDLSKIKLNESETSWSCPEEKYKELLETYGKTFCPGTFVVATDEDIVYLFCEDGFEKDGKTRVSQDTVFDIASLSKTFTAVSILQLYEQGKLNLDDTLDKYFPEYETGKKVTVDQLLHMTSGIPDYMNDPDPFWNVSGEYVVNKLLSDILQDRTTDEDFLNALYQAPLQFEPGSRYEIGRAHV